MMKVYLVLLFAESILMDGISAGINALISVLSRVIAIGGAMRDVW